MKKYEEDIVLDKMSLSDYFASAAFFVIREAEGPNILNDISYGRQDVQNEADAGSVSQIPSASNYRSNLKAKGFDDNEIVALAAVEAFGVVWDPKKLDTSKYPKLDNYFYKQLLSPASSGLVLQRELLSDGDLKVIVEKYAQDQKAFHESFGKAFVKLVELGHDDLTNVEHLLEDHPYKKFINMYY